MGLLDGVLDGLFQPLARTDRKLVRLIERGERVPGVLDAVRLRAAGDGSEHEIGLTVHAPSGTFRAGVRQQLFLSYGARARLGAEVLVLHLDGKVAVDWPATLAQDGVVLPGNPPVIAGRTLKEPMPPGIHDDGLDRKKLAQWPGTTATVLGAEQVFVMGMATTDLDVELRLADGRLVVKRKDYVPVYARHLAVPGAEVPVAVDPRKPERVVIDWGLAAERDAGLR